MVHATAMLHCTHLDKCGGDDDRDDYNHNNCDDYDDHYCDDDDDDENISYASGSYQWLSIALLNDWIDL